MDGGPDHRLTYASVQQSLLAMFIQLDLDFLCAVRTPPHNSWKNPAEKIMSILNLALQGVGIARTKTGHEEQLQKCKNMKQIREAAKSLPDMEKDILDALERLLSGWLKLKENPFSVFVAATEEEIHSLWENVRKIDGSLERTDTTKELTKGKKEYQEFMHSHCKIRHYMFSIKKCNDNECSVCKPPRLPDGDKYKDFEEVYGSQTSEKHRPSLSSPGAKTHGMPFPPSAQYAKNVKVVLQCGECLKWRVLYSKYSLKKDQREELEQLIEDLDYTCGSIFADIEAGEDSVLNSIYVKANLTCNSPIEIPYYTAGNAAICFHCGDENELQEDETNYPICLSCVSAGKKPVSRRSK